ncbi:MAG TPA: zinc-binding dehydrogenase [Bacteroidota bacterium]|nr:zinc-binding dehydrogenase [Bacteroidota bacterium]
MKAIVKPKPVDGKEWPKGFQILDRPEPKIEAPNDVIMEVFAGAICGTDVGIYNGKESLRTQMMRAKGDWITIGHEFSGRIVDAGPKAKTHLARLMIKKAKEYKDLRRIIGRKSPAALAGDRQFMRGLEKKFYGTAEMHVVCRTCYQCQLGEYHVCRNTVIKGVHDDGAWARYVKVPAENVRLFYGGEIPPEIISFMDALGNATHTVMSAPVLERSVAVLGCGVQGLMAVAVAKWGGAKRIYVTDASHDDASHDKLVASRFALAKKYGADHCFDVARLDEREAFVETVRRETDGTGVDAAYEMSGSYHAYKDALNVVRMGGTFALLGIPSGSTEINFARDIIFPGVVIRGIIGRKVFETWDQMERLLKSGLARQFMDTNFITHQFPLDRYEEAFEAIRKGDAYKVLLKP